MIDRGPNRAMAKTAKSALFGAAFAALLVLSSPARAAGDGLERLPDDTRPERYTLSITPDAAWERFSGRGALEFTVTRPTATVTVNAVGLKIGEAVLDGGQSAVVAYDTARQRATFTFPTPLPVGAHKISLSWEGAITRNVEGLFKVDYPTAEGRTGQMLFTHLCCIATARSFAPLWDQPDLKAVFDIDVASPAGDAVVANMPVERREDLPGGGARFHFAPTPKMSSYLLFFSVGAFDRIARQVGDTDVGVVLQRGKAEQGRDALNASAQALDYFNDYFGVSYPLPKLDNVGMPGAGGFGAMENWGAIFYFEPYILVDPAISTQADRQTVYVVVAHEVAHQWFGNLVTMKWWDDLWLNEGFASWMAAKTADHFHPEWQIWLQVADSREAAFRLDARSTTHPIVREVHTLEEATLAFDEITYEKGSQIIRMIEAWVGEAAFRTAIQAHVRNHAYGNATTADLLGELVQASDPSIKAIVQDFTGQEGVPLIEVLSTRCDADRRTSTVMLRQSRFGLDAPSRSPLSWRVPVMARTVGADTIARQVVEGPRPVAMTVPGCGPVKINAGETAYFRTRYDDASFDALASRFDEMAPADRLGLLADSFGLAEGGDAAFARYMDLSKRVSAKSDPLLALALAGNAGELDRTYAGLPGQAAFRTFIHARFAPMLADIGWVGPADEAANIGMLREALIDLLARTGDAATLAEATRRFRGAASDPALTPGGLRQAVVMAVGAGADQATFAELADRSAKATNSAEQRLYLMALANANDPAIARRALDMTLTRALPAQLFVPLLRAIAERHPALVYDCVTARYAEIAPKLDTYEKGAIVAMIAERGVDRALADRLAAYVSAGGEAAGKEAAERARSLILFRDGVRRNGVPQIDAWIRKQGA
ncbi:M1 family metallopeptidase [Phenylobacterium sp. LjRoot225]|uniref:M1 family metallopeptidase n=1 Tax=Phenylobacterium sp. LjRoot225 TaxID=3342285 RepID=UPI003ECF3808